MPNTYFEFRQFRIEQDRCAMKVGTDGVLLGAWFEMESGDSVLDIGTGTGLIALMAAQRGAGRVTAVEIDHDAALQAQENVSNSPFNDRITVTETDANALPCDLSFTRIVCNPPFFQNSLKCPDGSRNTARHDDFLSYSQLVSIADRHLSENGELSVVLPHDMSEIFKKTAISGGLCQKRECNIVTVTGKTPKRTLMTFSRNYCEPMVTTLVMCNPSGEKTADFTELIKDFYVKY